MECETESSEGGRAWCANDGCVYFESKRLASPEPAIRTVLGNDCGAIGGDVPVRLVPMSEPALGRKKEDDRSAGSYASDSSEYTMGALSNMRTGGGTLRCCCLG